ncbi:DUF2993 domain-containing protein [Microbacterium sp. M3]|uniref:DUF2993 domain-containing protein n=1 Tax=Microbacterium arthrosphaerae TaxID=792652 RepID=A0ABU4H3D8_9MICO|nr:MULTISPECIES: DUF2993 domain-containing protein [Microbacterium]MDW4573232.1 DUF2993 domain-containing protein [Microbacterium arthrosphaerae]MDW7607087.1 DUF2993 domain-containing protein [Microbacterium sp. M3]
MSTADAQPTLPLPDLEPAGEPERPRRRAWPWILAFAIVAVLAVAAWFAAEAIARQVVTGVVRDQVRTQLALPADQPIDVDIPGVLIPQLIGGSIDELTIASDDVEFGGVTGDVTVTANDVAVRGTGEMSGATATVALDEQQLRTLLGSLEGFPVDTLALDAPDVTMTLDLQLFGMGIPVGVALTPSVAEGGSIVLTPASLQLGQSAVSADALRDQFGGVADTVLRDWDVCVAQYLPAGVTLTAVAVEGDQLVADFDVDGAIATDPALRENGTCA